MDEKDIQKQAEGTDTFENQDVKALEEMRKNTKQIWLKKKKNIVNF